MVALLLNEALFPFPTPTHTTSKHPHHAPCKQVFTCSQHIAKRRTQTEQAHTHPCWQPWWRTRRCAWLLWSKPCACQQKSPRRTCWMRCHTSSRCCMSTGCCSRCPRCSSAQHKLVCRSRCGDEKMEFRMQGTEGTDEERTDRYTPQNECTQDELHCMRTGSCSAAQRKSRLRRSKELWRNAKDQTDGSASG